MRIPTHALRSLVAGGLGRAGASTDSATVTAESIVYAEASGIESHGLVRVGPLIDQLRSGKIRGSAVFEPVRVGGSVCLVDAQEGLGYAAASVATDTVLDMLRSSPVAVASVSRSHHFGVAARYTEQLAEAGFVGLALSGTTGAVSPIGGVRPLLGNPPLSLAVPRRDAGPLVIDMAPAVVARGRIAAAAAQGAQIPLGWGRDEHGRPTTDPAAAMRGTLEVIGGEKGVVLAMLIDVLVAALTTSDSPGEGRSVFTPDGLPPRLGHLIIGFAPARFGVDPQDKIASYLSELRVDGAGMRVPGERRRELRAASDEKGIEVSPGTWRTLREAAGAEVLGPDAGRSTPWHP